MTDHSRILTPGQGVTYRHGPQIAPLEQIVGATDDVATVTFADAPPPPPTGNRDGTKADGPWKLALMPVRQGMKVAFYTDFTEDGDRNLGAGFGPHLSRGIRPRPDAARDGTYQDSSQRGTYSVRDTWSQKAGIGDVYLHSHKVGGDPLKHDPSGPVHKVMAWLDQQDDQKEAFVQWTEKMPTTPGRKQAPLFWAFGTNVNGEDDHAENKYGSGPRSNAFHHFYGGGGQESVRLNVVTTEPHVYGAYFRRKGARGTSDPGEFSVYVDGQLRKTFNNKCTPNPMHFVMQIETYLKRDPLPPIASDGHVQFTKYRMDVPA